MNRLDRIKNILKNKGYKFISIDTTSDNKNLEKTKITYECVCGNIDTTSISNIRQRKYCTHCHTNHFATLKFKRQMTEKYGGYNSEKIREKKRKTCLERYGVENEQQSLIIKNRIKSGMMEKYGVEHNTQREEYFEKTTKTCMDRYGVTAYPKTNEWKDKYFKTIKEKYGFESPIQFMNKNCSKESQSLLDSIYNLLPIEFKEKSHYATLAGGEFCIKYQDKFFKYDFVNSLSKKCIEYNGFNFHPRLDQLDEEIGWFAFDKEKTVKSARDHEKIKFEGLEERGYKILLIWDYEFKNNPELVIERCLSFILENPPSNSSERL